MENPNRTCDRCGSGVRSNASFCPQCGAPLAAPPPPEGGIPPTQVAPVQPGVPPTEVIPPPQAEPGEPPGAPPYQPPPPPQPEPPRRSRTCLILGGIGLAVVILICCLGVGSLWVIPDLFESATSTPTHTQVSAVTQPPTAQAPATILPTEGSTPVDPPPPEALPPTVSYGSASFSHDPGQLGQVVPETVPASTDPSVAVWDLAPEHSVFNFTGYPLHPEAYNQPQVFVYPANEYAGVNPEAGVVIADLRAFLMRQPAVLGANEEIPFLPIWPAAQMLQADIDYLEFQNGLGVHFLTAYGQDVYPISNRSLFYTFQGMTHDTNFYISAVLPVAHPILDEADSITVDDAWVNNFSQYIASLEQDLSTQPPESFTPNLSALDEMMRSFLAE